MPRNKSITSIDNRIKKVQEDLFKTKARLDKLTAELRGLEREKKFRQQTPFFKRYLKVANPSMMC